MLADRPSDADDARRYRAALVEIQRILRLLLHPFVERERVLAVLAKELDGWVP